MSEPFLGEIVLFAGNFAPRGWAFCQGQILPINQNQSLFAILGTMYGGDGRTSFALPDLRGRVPVGVGSGAGLTNRAVGEEGGTESHPLTIGQIPAHTHAVDASGGLRAELVAHAGSQANQDSPAPEHVIGYSKGPPVNVYSDSNANLTSIGGVDVEWGTGGAGSGQSHENRQPYLALNYIIALQGLFPSRA